MVRIPGMNRLAGQRRGRVHGARACSEDAGLVGHRPAHPRSWSTPRTTPARASVLPELRAEVERASLTPGARGPPTARCASSTRGPGPTRTGASPRGGGSRSSSPARPRTSSPRSSSSSPSTRPARRRRTRARRWARSSPACPPRSPDSARATAWSRSTATRRRRSSEVSARIRASHGRPITITVRRGGSTVTLGPEKTVKSGSRWIWGFVPAAETVAYSPGHSVRLAAAATAGASSPAPCRRSRASSARTGRASSSSTVGIVKISNAALKVELQLVPADPRLRQPVARAAEPAADPAARRRSHPVHA